MSKRIQSFDGIRAIAVITVVAFHSHVPGFGLGMLGVDVFFVLSGYLITSILLTKPINLSEFYIRRFRRLSPPLALLLIAMFAIRLPNDQLFASATYSMDYAKALLIRNNSVIGHTWSLSVEEHFYLIWPIAMIALKRLPRKVWLPTLATAFVLATVWRDFNFVSFGHDATYYRFDTRLSGLILGGLIAVDANKIWLAIVLAISVAFSALSAIDPMTLGVSVAELVTVVVLIQLRKPSVINTILSNNVLAWIGKMSYGIYLFHFPIVQLLLHSNFNIASVAAITIATSLGLAAISFYTVERFAQTIGRN